MDENLKEKIPPQSIDAEKSVLGAMLIDEQAVLVAMDILNDNSFYRTSHRKIFVAVTSLFERSEAVDVITVSEELKKKREYKSFSLIPNIG